MYQLTQCPICKGNSFKPAITCIDHTVSHETFSLVRCQACGLLATSPRPDDIELGKYYLSDNYISHSEKTQSLFDLLYKVSRNFTLRWKYNLIKQNMNRTTAQEELLDYGCGTGDFIKRGKANGFTARGIEPSQAAAAIAHRNTGLEIKSSLTQVSQNFSVITLWHVLEHIPDLNETVDRLKQLLSKNGTMFIAVPNHKSHDAKVYEKHWAAYDVPRHLWHFDSHTMHQLMAIHRLHIHKIIPMKLDAYYVSILSEKNRRGTNSIAAMVSGAFCGLLSNLRANKNEYSSLIYVIKHGH